MELLAYNQIVIGCLILLRLVDFLKSHINSLNFKNTEHNYKFQKPIVKGNS